MQQRNLAWLCVKLTFTKQNVELLDQVFFLLLWCKYFCLRTPERFMNFKPQTCFETFSAQRDFFYLFVIVFGSSYWIILRCCLLSVELLLSCSAHFPDVSLLSTLKCFCIFSLDSTDESKIKSASLFYWFLKYTDSFCYFSVQKCQDEKQACAKLSVFYFIFTFKTSEVKLNVL